MLGVCGRKDYFTLQKQVLDILLKPGSLGAGQWYSSSIEKQLKRCRGQLGMSMLLNVGMLPWAEVYCWVPLLFHN